ncbi:MAG: aminotransferase class V-fold PLP-dependent enzyme, partial [Methylobacter sp.]
MNTNEFDKSTPVPQGYRDNAGLNESLPDIEQLTKLANELFSALPGGSPSSGLASSAAQDAFASSLASADKSKIAGVPPQGVGQLEEGLQKSHVPHPPSFEAVPGGLDTGSVFGNPLAETRGLASPFTGLGHSVLEGVYPKDFGLLDEAELQKLLATRPPSGSFLPGTVDAGSSTTLPSSVAANELTAESQAEAVKLLEASIAPQTSEAELQKLFAALSTPPGHIPASTGSGSSFYFLDELKTNGFNAQVLAFNSAHPPFDVHVIRRDFPILKERVNGQPLVWFDNAATTQKPQAVIDRVSYFYEHENSNIHRAAHELAARATDAYEKARDIVARFTNASSSSEIVFVRGTTEAINLVAQSWGGQNIGAGDEIVITWLEHHANIVPWKQLCDATGAILRIAPVDEDGQVLLGEYQKLLNSHTKLVAFTQVSNALGTVTPAKEMIEMAHRVGARVLLDGAQSVSHLRVDVQALDCDWFVFSG